MKLKKKQEGITLIALIITIIVMLILVGVTINVALNGGLFIQAQDAARDTQKEAEREQLLSAVVTAYDTKTGLISKSKLITNLGTGWSVDGPEGGPYTVISPKGNVFTVERNGNIIDGKVNGGEPSENENGFKIKVVQSYDITTNKIGLQITTEVTDEELAVAIFAEIINTMNPESNASTLQDINLILANMDLAEGQEPYSNYSDLVAAMAEMLNKDNPTDQEIFAKLNGDQTIQEAGSVLLMQCAEFTINGKTIEDDENLDRTETEIEYNGITENGEYNIQLKFGDKIASKTITVSSIITGENVESAKIEKGYWYDVTLAYPNINTDNDTARMFCVVVETSESELEHIAIAQPNKNSLTSIPSLIGLYYFRENFEENGITYETAIVQKKAMIGSGSDEYEIVGWITKQGNLVLKNSTTKKFMEFAKQQMPNYSENFDEIYDTTLNPSNLLGGNNYTISFGLLKNGKCQYIYRNEEYGIEMIYSNGPVNYRIEDGKLIIEEIENWDYDTGTGGTGKGTYKEYTIGTEAIKR